MAQAEAFEASRPLIHAFERLGIDYLIGGSLASSYHGRPRSTQDVDLVADLKVQGNRLDFEYLDQWVVHSGVADLLEQARLEAGL